MLSLILLNDNFELVTIVYSSRTGTYESYGLNACLPESESA